MPDPQVFAVSKQEVIWTLQFETRPTEICGVPEVQHLILVDLNIIEIVFLAPEIRLRHQEDIK
jgi:hypothetical protein